MLEKDRINLYKIIFYITVIIGIIISGYTQYQRWINPRGLNVEMYPKQHDGSQEFRPPVEFESSVTPAPDEDGTTRYLDPVESHRLGEQSLKDLEKQEDSPKEQKDILVVPKIGLDH